MQATPRPIDALPSRGLLTRFVPALLALAGALATSACAHEYLVEDRLTPVHVWLAAPDLARAGGSVDALVYVGSEKVVEGLVSFPAGVTTVTFPTVRVNTGGRLVQVVLAGGTVAASETVVVKRETWVLVTYAGGIAKITSADEEPLIPR